MKQADLQGAIAAYRKLVQANPGSAKFHFLLGQAYYRAGHLRESTEALEEALKLDPGLKPAQDALGASLAESGHCGSALPYLKQAVARGSNADFERTLGLDGLKCSMELDHEDDALAFIERLRRQFPRDPEVLYVTVHAFSDLSIRASQQLLNTDPGSYQVHELAAEADGARGKWTDAAKEYRKVLAIDPNAPGIHYMLGRLILSEPLTPTTFEDAKKEFEAELKVNPHNAGAEYVLGDLAVRARDVKTAIERFSKACADDPHFAAARIELGKSLISTQQFTQAIPPLESAVKLEPKDPTARYLLATAYRGAGRMDDAQKEFAAYEKAAQEARQANQRIQSAVIGRKTPAQLEQQSSHPRR